MSTYGVRTRFIELVAGSGGAVSAAAYQTLVDYAAERELTAGEVRALLRPAVYFEASRVLRARNVRLADIRLDGGAWAIAEKLAADFRVTPIFDRCPNARPAGGTRPSGDDPWPVPPPPPPPATGVRALGPTSEWKVTTTGATVTFVTKAANQMMPAVVFDLPQWTDPSPRDGLGAHAPKLAGATSLAELTAALDAAVADAAAYLAADDVPDLGKNRRWGLQDLRRHAFFDAAAQAAAGARLPGGDKPRVAHVIATAKEKLLCDRDYPMETGSHTNYWPYWKNYAGALAKVLAQTAPGTDDYWQIKNRLEEIWTRKTVTSFRREVDEKDVERSAGMAVVQRRPYGDDTGHRISMAKESFPTAPKYEVLHLADGATKVYRDGDKLYVDGPGRVEVTAEQARGVKARKVGDDELGLRPLDGAEPRGSIAYDWNRDGAVDLTAIDISWWGHCHNEAPLNALGIDPRRGVDVYRADPKVPADKRLQRFTADDVWDLCGALAADHEGGYATRDAYRMRETQVEVTKFVGSRNDGGHWILIDPARPDARRIRIDAEVTELWHKADPTQMYPDPAARFRRDLPDGDGAFAPNPEWVKSESDDDDEITVDGLGRRMTLRTTFVTFDATGHRYQAKETIKLDPNADSFVKLADEILSASPSGGGRVTEHWYNAKRGAYYAVLAEVAATGGRREVSRGAPVPVRTVQLRQETVYDSVIDVHDFVTKNMGLPFVFDTSSGLAVWNYPVDKVRLDRLGEVERSESGARFTYTRYRLRYTTMGGPGGDAKYLIKRDAAGNPVRAVAEDPMPDFAFRNEHWVCAPATTDQRGTPSFNVAALQAGYLLDKSGEYIVSGLWQRLATLVYVSLSAAAGAEPVRLLEAADGTLSIYDDAAAWAEATKG